MAEGDPTLHWHLDQPVVDGSAPLPAVVEVRGWLGVKRGHAFDHPVLDIGRAVPLRPQTRPDVERALPDRDVLGFQSFVAMCEADVGREWAIDLRVDGDPHRLPVPVAADEATVRQFERTKREKLTRLRPLLRCPGDGEGPACGGELEDDGPDGLVCSACGASYARTEHHADFLTPALRRMAAVGSSDNLSSLGFESLGPELAELLADAQGGLVLDCGSGVKQTYDELVVNLDIVDFPTTDVLGVNERLPFADEVFDAVLSVAVLEHVRDPLGCAAEIGRVVRPGGRIYMAVPQLVPYHDYPDHYFNVTRDGLEAMFSDRFAIDTLATPDYGLPVHLVTWAVRDYLHGLPADAREELAAMTVADLCAPSASGGAALPFGEQLSPHATEALAGSHLLVARKRG